MTRPIALTLANLFLFFAAACIEEEDPPITFCEVEQGHLCGESAPGVMCPAGLTCEPGPDGIYSCQRSCFDGNDAQCVHPFCEGKDCESNYACRPTSDRGVDTGEYACDSGIMLYVCADEVEKCPERWASIQDWCVYSFWAWAESGL